MAFTLKVDPDEFTVGDLEDFEDVTGVSLNKALAPVQKLDDDGKPVFDEKGRPEKEVNMSPKSLKALIWIVKRKEEPGFTIEDARNVKVNELELADSDPQDADPNEHSASVTALHG